MGIFDFFMSDEQKKYRDFICDISTEHFVKILEQPYNQWVIYSLEKLKTPKEKTDFFKHIFSDLFLKKFYANKSDTDFLFKFFNKEIRNIENCPYEICYEPINYIKIEDVADPCGHLNRRIFINIDDDKFEVKVKYLISGSGNRRRNSRDTYDRGSFLHERTNF